MRRNISASNILPYKAQIHFKDYLKNSLRIINISVSDKKELMQDFWSSVSPKSVKQFQK